MALKISEKPQLSHDDSIANSATHAMAARGVEGTAARRAMSR